MRRWISFLLALILTLSVLADTAPSARAVGDKLVALTFDDGPSAKYTGLLLDGLKERNVSATFFMLGYRAQYNQELVRRAYEEGHEIACHSWDHPDLRKLSTLGVRAQMEMSLGVLDLACGVGSEYLVRAPYGRNDERVRSAIDGPLVFWSVDSRDWELRDAQKVGDKICEEAYDGCIILCHDIHQETVPAALAAIDQLLAEGYEFVTVSELYRRRGVELEDHKRYYRARPGFSDPGPIPEPLVQLSYSGGGAFDVTITCADENAPIYYTLDGTYPDQEAARYTGPLSVEYGTQVTAVAAYKLNGSRSQTVWLSRSDYPVVTPEMILDRIAARILGGAPEQMAQLLNGLLLGG